MPSTYSLLVQSCEEVSWIRRKAPNLYVSVHQEGHTVLRTPVIKRERVPEWKHLCNLPSDSPITLQLWHDSLLRCRDVRLGSVHVTIATLLDLTRSENEFVGLQLTGEDREFNGKRVGTLFVRLMDNQEAAAMTIGHIQQDLEGLTLGGPSSALIEAPQMVKNSNPVPETFEACLGILLSKLEVIISIGDQITKIHPYANIAWKILTSVYQAAKTQQATDDKLRKLATTMVSVYSFAKETDGLAQNIKNLEDKVLAIVQQTVECALFIREYTGNGFTARAIRNTWDNTDKTIDDLADALLNLKASLEGSLTVHGIFLSTQVLQKLDGLVQLDALKTLDPVKMNAASRPTCLAGTRVQLLQEITEWLMDPSGSGNFLWLSGVAGSGKSTISTTVSESFRGLHRLGAFLFFDRNDPAHSNPDRVIHTLAYSLARCNPHIGSAISAVIQKDPDIVNAPLQTQFKALLLDPLLSVQQYMQGPILIILDALDECGNSQSRRNLLSVISTEFSKLPYIFRFLVTSRREADLSHYFGNHFVEKSIGTAASAQDVRLFIYHEMERIRNFNELEPAAWPKPTQMQAIIALADGLFIWAATAVKFIDGYNPQDRMETLITSNSTTLDTLYTITLRNSAPWDDPTFAMDARAVLACIVFGQVPMTSTTIDMLLGSRYHSLNVLKHLGCVVQWQPGCAARILHASFADYLTDGVRSKGQPWAIDSEFGHHKLALGCLQILNDHLRFNICSLEDSHVLNTDVPDLSSRITTNISPYLSYSSCFWSNHMTSSQFDRTILEGIHQFFYWKFLFWIEVLSLLNQIPIVSDVLLGTMKYIKAGPCSYDHKNDLEELIVDMNKFVAVFGPVISQSAPHIYISALAFAPQESKSANHFKRWFPNTASVNSPLGIKWPAIQKILRGHNAVVFSVDFCPDGTRVASGSSDRTVRIWDTHTGQLTCMPLQCLKEAVMYINFSPDGTQIALVSNNKTFCVWDAQTGVLVSGPFTGHTKTVKSVHFSPDGTQIASGSTDKTVCVWDAQTGALIAGPFTGHTDAILYTHFSPDGRQIASASLDKTMRVWDAQTGVLVTPPFIGHTESVLCVCFSPVGTHIGTGSMDCTIRVWDVQTGVIVAGPFTGHTGPVWSIDFSSNGRQIVSGSSDHKVCVWDAQTGALTAGPFKGHTDMVYSVCFSPDSRQIVSGSADNTVCLWDAQHGPVIDQTFAGHTHQIECVCFSPDGMQIVSGSYDHMIRVWNTQTGALVAGPFIGHTSSVMFISFSADGTKIASAGSFDKTVRIWDVQTGVLVCGPIAHTDWVWCVSLSPDGTRVTCGCQGPTFCVWDAKSGVLVAGPITGHTSTTTCVQFSPDGAQIVSGSVDKTICVWDAQTGARIGGPFTGHTDWIRSVCFSPNGTQIASGSLDQTVRVWDARSGILISGPFIGHTDKVQSVHFSPDGTRIASGSRDGTVRVWDAQTGALAAGPFTGHSGPVMSVHFSPDSKQVTSGSYDKTLRVSKVGRSDQTDISMNSSSKNPQEELFILDSNSGWIRDAAGSLLLWVPPWLREGLYLPHNTLVISTKGTTKLDISRFVHGREWVKCFDHKFIDAQIEFVRSES